MPMAALDEHGADSGVQIGDRKDAMRDPTCAIVDPSHSIVDPSHAIVDPSHAIVGTFFPVCGRSSPEDDRRNHATHTPLPLYCSTFDSLNRFSHSRTLPAGTWPTSGSFLPNLAVTALQPTGSPRSTQCIRSLSRVPYQVPQCALHQI